MGFGNYSTENRTLRSTAEGYYTKSTEEIFTNRSIDNLMNPYDVKIRESRDSEEHPESLAIILALDETGSMKRIPHELIKDGLPSIMSGLMETGIEHPQILFIGIGDHVYDNAPLQISQFETSDELLDKWLTKVYLEGKGGGNNGESYMLAWYFAANHTSIDCFEKRNQKGFLFTIGDEPVLPTIDNGTLRKIMGSSAAHPQLTDQTSKDLLKAAQDKYHVYHLHIKEGWQGEREDVMNGWRELMGENLIIIEDYRKISTTINEIIIKHKTEIHSSINSSIKPKKHLL
jgi:hypothetical protein